MAYKNRQALWDAIQKRLHDIKASVSGHAPVTRTEKSMLELEDVRRRLSTAQANVVDARHLLDRSLSEFANLNLMMNHMVLDLEDRWEREQR